MNNIPRRIDTLRHTPAEKSITEAMVMVEQAGCHPLLTDAVVLLGKAREKVADFMDGAASPAEPSSPAGEAGERGEEAPPP
jgi:hypothetical protein